MRAGSSASAARSAPPHVGDAAELDIFQPPVSPFDAPDVDGLYDVPRSIDLDRSARTVEFKTFDKLGGFFRIQPTALGFGKLVDRSHRVVGSHRGKTHSLFSTGCGFKIADERLVQFAVMRRRVMRGRDHPKCCVPERIDRYLVSFTGSYDLDA